MIKNCTNCKRRKREKNRTTCRKCRHKKYVEADPVRASYVVLKQNAKRRNKTFTITLAYFRKFCYRTDYIAGKGRNADSYTVDQIKEHLGYIPGNLQVKTNGDNVRKYLRYSWETKQATVMVDKRTNDFLF